MPSPRQFYREHTTGGGLAVNTCPFTMPYCIMLRIIQFTDQRRELYGLLIVHWTHLEMDLKKSVQNQEHSYRSLLHSFVPDPGKAPGDSNKGTWEECLAVTAFITKEQREERNKDVFLSSSIISVLAGVLCKLWPQAGMLQWLNRISRPHSWVLCVTSGRTH